MCLAMPRRVLHVERERAKIEWDGGPLWVATGGTPDLAVGDYVLVHAGQVLDRISAEEAEQILALYATLEGADVSLLVAEPAEEVRA
jgi:hydrogenase expression/formation protein HypC